MKKQDPLYIIATELLGYVEDKCPPDVNGENGGTVILVPDSKFIDRNPRALPHKGAVHPTYFVPRFSESLDAALMLVRAVNAAGIEVDVKFSIGIVDVHTKGGGDSGNPKDLPEIITKAIANGISLMNAKEKRLIKQQLNKVSVPKT
jgi:hypothetical protein